MSEIFSFPIEAEERLQESVTIAGQAAESRNAVGKNIDNDPLTSYVEANADKSVICWWMNNEVVTVSAAALAYSANVALITEDNIHAVALELSSLPAAEEKMEEEENKKAAEEESAETEEKNDKKIDERPKAEAAERKIKAEAKTEPTDKNPDKIKLPKQPAKKPADIFNPETPPDRTEKSVKPESRVSVEAEPETGVRQAEPEQPGQSEAEAPVAARVTPEVPVPRTADDETEVASDNTLHTVTKETELSVITPEAEGNAETIAKPYRTDYEEAAGVSAAEDLVSGETEVHAEEDEPVQDYGIEINNLRGFIEDEPTELIENEVLNLRAFESGLEIEAQTPTLTLTRPDVEPLTLEQTVAPDAEQLTVDELDVEKIEDSLREALERATDAGPETARSVSEILDKIIEMPSELEDIGYGDVSAEERTAEELQGRFAELLTVLNIDYSDELLEALALLAIRTYRYDKTEGAGDKRTDDTPREYGTREIKVINQLLSCLGAIPRTLADVYIIGRSAIQLSFDLAA